MTAHESDCALALERLRMRRLLRRTARAFVADMAHRARVELARGNTPPLTSHQTHWLLELVLEHAKSLNDTQLIADSRMLLRGQYAA